MKNRIIEAVVLFVALALSLSPLSPGQISPPTSPVNIIIDVDAGNDVSIDDGIYAAIRLHQLGYIKLLGFTTSASSVSIPDSAAHIQTYLNWAGLRTVPVGAFHGSFPAGAQYIDNDYCHFYQGQTTPRSCAGTLSALFQNAAYRTSASEYPEAVTVLRRVLASAADDSVVMIEMGMSQNFDALLNSSPDAISMLSGHDLIAAKVKYLVQMGGKNPTSTPSCCTPQGAEWNFQHAPAEASHIAANWPTTIYYSGFEVGYPGPVLGSGTIYNLSNNNPLYRAHQMYGSESRYGWDVLALFFVVQGTTNGYFSLSENGTQIIDPITGANTFSVTQPSTPARHYLIQSKSSAEFTSLLNPLLGTEIGVPAPGSYMAGKSGSSGLQSLR